MDTASLDPANNPAKDPANSLQATLHKMEMTLSTIADAIVWTDAQQQIEWYNPAFDRLMGHPPTSLIGSRLNHLLPLVKSGQPVAPEDYPDAKARRREYQTTDYRFPQGDRSRQLEIIANPISSEGGQSVVLVLRDVTQANRVAAERQQVEQEQEKTLSLLKATLESTVDGILVVTHDRNTPVYNQKFLQMWGLSESLMQPGVADERLRALSEQTKDPEGFTARIWELFRDRPEETVLDTLEFKDGRIFERYSQPLRNGDQVIGRVWSFRDVAERRRNEQALQQQATAIKASIDGIAILDANETYVYLNDSHARIYGYDNVQELIGKNWKILYGEAEQQRLEQEAFPVFQRTGHWQGEAIGIRRDGSAFPQEVSLSATQTGGLVCIVRDISHRKQAEAALRQAEERYRSIFENAVVGIYQITPEGQYLSVNPTLAQMYGYESPERMIAHLTDISQQVYVKGDRWQEFRHLLATHDTVTDFETEVYRQDGSTLWVSENARTVRDTRGAILYYEGTSIDITERRQAEQALRNSEERLRLALEAGQMGIWDWNILTGAVKWSDNLEEVHGMEPGSFGGTFEEFLQIVHPQDRQWVGQEITRAVEGGTDYDIEFRILWADGSIHWIAGKGQTFHNSTGRAIRMIGTGMDITQRKQVEADRQQAETALRQSEERLRLTLDFSRIGIWSWDLVTGALTASEESMRLVGLEPGVEVSYPLWRNLVHPADIDPVEQALTHALQTHTDYDAEYRVIYPDRSIRWIVARGRCVYDDAGQPLRMLGVLIDITDRKLAEDALRESEAKLRLTLEFARIGTWDWNIAAAQMLLDESAIRLLQIAPGETDTPGDAWFNRIHPDDADPFRQMLQAALANHADFEAEYRILLPDGNLRWLLDQGRGVYDEAGQPVRMLGVLIDITDRKQAEEALRQSEARFRILYEATGLAVLLLDETGFFDCNQAAADLLGYPRQDIVGKYPSELSPPYQMDGQDSASLASQLIDLTLEQGSSRFEWIHQRPDGTEFPVEVWLTTVVVGDRHFIQAIIQDLTERKQVEAALAEQASLEAFRADVDNALAQSDTLPVMLQRCAAAVVVHLNAAFARIWTLNPEENMMELKASAGMYTRLNGTYSRIPVGSPKIGRIAQDHQPIITNDIQNDSLTFNQDWVNQEGFVAFASYPLMLGDQFQGVIAMFSRKPITDAISEALGFAASEIALGIGRKRAEAALRESELKFRTIVENANDIIFSLTPEGIISYISPNVFHIHGYEPAEMEGKSFAPYIHPDDLPICLEALNRALTSSENQFGLEYRTLHQQGGWRWQVANMSVSQDVEGRPLIVGIARDITEQKRIEAERQLAEDALRESEAQYRDLVETANSIIIRWGTDGTMQFINDYGQHFFGYHASEILHRNVVGTIVPKFESSGRNLQAMVRDMQHHPENYAVNENENIRQNGERVWVMWANKPILDEDGNIIEILSVGTDATERKRTEEALQRSELKFRTIVENANDIIYVHDSEGNFTYVSPNVTSILGYALSEVEQGSFTAIAHPDDLDRCHDVLQRVVVQGEKQQNLELRIRHRDGSWRWFSCNESPISDSDGQVMVMGVARDITDRKRTEAQIQENLNLLDGVINGTSDFIFVKNLEGQYILVNRAFVEAFGKPAQEIVGADDYAIFPPETARQIEAIDRTIFAEGTVKTFEEAVPIRGQVHTFFTTKTLYRDGQGNVRGLIGIARDISDRKRAEEALRLSELKFRNIFNNSQVGIFRTGIEDGLILEANQKYVEFTGYQFPEELLNQHYSTEFYINPEDRQRMLNELQETGEVNNFEMQFRRLDGAIRWGMYSVRLNPDEHCLEGVIADISDRKQLEAELRQSQQFLDSILNNIPLALFTKDIQNDFRYVLINQNSDQILGFPREGAIGKNDYDLLPKALADAYRKQDQRAVDLGTLHEIPEYPIQTREGTILARSMKLPLFDSQGNPTYLLCISEDITERKRQEEALRLIVEGTAAKTGDDFFRTCARYLAEVLQVHCAFVTEWSNEQHTRVRLLAMWLGGSFSDNFEFDLCGTPCENVVRGKQLYFYPENVPSLFPYDPYIPMLQAESYLGIPLRDSSGKMLGYLAVTDNKPMKPDPGRELILKVFAARAGAELERKQSETALMVAKEAAEAANRAKSTFLANMSHELRTPLNSILGFTQLMVRDTSLATQQRNFLETINRSGEHLLTLINDVLEMSKIEAGRTVLNPESFDLHLLLHTVYEMFQERADNKYLALEFDQSADLPQYVVADEGKLRQILINLLSNAIKFTLAGRVSLAASVLSRHGNIDAVQRQPTDSQWILYFEVEDTGIGIAPDELETLFQPFVQTSSGNQNREGTGLGLAISHQFVQLMGGSISVTSTLGQGSVFSFDVPVLLVDPAAVPAPVAYKQVIALAPDQPIYRILIVDDRPENRDLVTQLLLKVGFEVRTANNGQEAIAQWQTWHPHLIWMDMRMPVMDGYEATRRIRDVESRVLLCVKNSTKIIALTASAFDEQQSTILAAGCDDLVIKPFREAVIFEKMATHLGVEYVYATEPSMEEGDEMSAETPTTVPGFVLRPESFDSMPPEWVKRLHQAALAVDGDQIRQLVEQIPAGDRSLAEALNHLVQQYNFDEILELTQGMN